MVLYYDYKNGGLQSKLMEVTNEEIAVLHSKLLSNKMPQREQALVNVQVMGQQPVSGKASKGVVTWAM